MRDREGNTLRYGQKHLPSIRAQHVLFSTLPPCSAHASGFQLPSPVASHHLPTGIPAPNYLRVALPVHTRQFLASTKFSLNNGRLKIRPSEFKLLTTNS